MCHTFIHKNSLKRHIRNQHENVETVGCQICGSVFKNMESLKYHINKYHDQENDLELFFVILVKVLNQIKSKYAVTYFKLSVGG